MSPQVAAKNKWARIEALLHNHGFIEKYRIAFLDHIAGLANVIFFVRDLLNEEDRQGCVRSR